MRSGRVLLWLGAMGLMVTAAGCFGKPRVPDRMLAEAAPPDGMADASRRAPTEMSATSQPVTSRSATSRPVLSAVSLTLRQALEWALRNNLRLRIERLTPDIRDAQVTEALGAFDPIFANQYAYVTTEQPSTTSALVPGPRVNETSSHAFQSALQQRLITGAQAQIGFDWTRTSTNNPFSEPDPRDDTGLRAGITQPLLRNFGVGINTAAIRIARNDKMGSIYDFRKTVEETLEAVEETYWLLYLSIQELQVRRRQLERAQDLLERAKRLVEAGRSPRVEQTRAEAEVARVQSEIVNSENTVRRAEDTLKRLLYHPDLCIGSSTRMVPADAPGDTFVSVDLVTALCDAVEKRPDLRSADFQVNSAQIRVKAARNQRLPRLDAGVEWVGRGARESFGPSFSDAFSTEFPESRVFVQSQIPIGNRAANSQYLQARLAREQAVLGVAEILKNQVEFEVTRAHNDLQTDREKIRATREATRTAQIALQDEEALYRAGRSTRTDVLQATTAVAEAELEEIRAVVGHNVNIARFFKAQGTYLEQNRIMVDAVPGN